MFNKKAVDGNSKDWKSFAKAYIKDNGNECALCGSSKNLNLHIIIPKVNVESEYDPDNLVILCEGNKDMNCHYLLGHLWDWGTYNPTLKEDLDEARKRMARRGESIPIS